MTGSRKMHYERVYVSYPRRDAEYRCHQPDQADWSSHRTWSLEYVSRVQVSRGTPLHLIKGVPSGRPNVFVPGVTFFMQP